MHLKSLSWTLLSTAVALIVGALSEIAGSPYGVGTQPNSVAVDPTGKFAYVTGPSTHNIYTYTLNASTGALGVVAGSTFPPAANGGWNVTVAPAQ